MVGSILLTVQPGQTVKRGEEYGYVGSAPHGPQLTECGRYFAFGGSTIVTLFEPGTIHFDDDILENSSQSIETLVRVGMRIGRRVR